ncbi:hypothetical protein QJQ45_024337, partial [Haematococcus lacustris]
EPQHQQHQHQARRSRRSGQSSCWANATSVAAAADVEDGLRSQRPTQLAQCPPKAHDVMAAAVGEAVLAAAAMVAAAEAAQQESNSHIATPWTLPPNPTLSHHQHLQVSYAPTSPLPLTSPRTSSAQLASCPLASCSFPLLHHHHLRNPSTFPHPSGQPGAGASSSPLLPLLPAPSHSSLSS